MEEIRQPIPERMYCADPKCGSYIPKDSQHSGMGNCVGERCWVRTCLTCYEIAHAGHTIKCRGYPKDLYGDGGWTIEAMLEKQGWKRCPGCQIPIELDSGCNHVECPCGAEFCFAC
ncbi:hypothetical protein BJ508DRAFT_242406, partial [Ascobolus immersus RN42]